MPQKVTHLRHVGVAAPNFDETVAFYSDAWGLKKVDGEDGIAFFAAEGSPENYILRVRKADEKRVDLLAFGAEDAAHVDEIANNLAANGVGFISEPGELKTPGGGYGFRFFDTDGRTCEVSSGVAQRESRELEPGESIPVGLSHAVLGSANQLEAIEFYRRNLGFKMSDWIGNQMCFMRCTTNEHDLAIFRGESKLNHVAFLFRGIDEFMRATGRVMKTGAVMQWGSGRHVVGDNTFSYFYDPNGNVSEITTDMEQCSDDWQPRQMVESEAGDQWGTAKFAQPDMVPPAALEKETGFFVAPPV
ncbi:MAG TPA: VOC family protein [Dehalococcoidia bacterium]|nr:VOC family protein [Dehalococcoidia bacterium]